MKLALTLTARLTLLYSAVSVLVLCGLGFMVTRANEAHFVDLDRGFLQEKAALVQRLVADSTSVEQLRPQLQELEQSHTGLHLNLLQETTLLFGQTTSAFPPLEPASVPMEPEQFTTGDWVWEGTTLRGGILEIAAPVHMSNQAPLRLWLATDTHHHTHFMDDLRQSVMVFLLAAALASGLLAWWAARRGLAPLRDMRERARRVTAHQLGERMPEDSVPVEMAELARELNTMLARLQADFQRLSEFSSDLAHELRTPISNLLTQTQVTLAQPREASAYRDTLASNAEEFQRLGRMVSDMLLLAKTEHGLALPHREQVALGEQTRALFDFYDAVAEERSIRLRLEGDAFAFGDKLMLRRAISNLLSNAIRHAPASSTVAVRLSRVRGETLLCVENAGPGIAPEHLPRLFDRFYRVDKSRLHLGSDGSGLGLAITQAIMVSHGGSVSGESQPDLTRFCLRFPASGPPSEPVGPW